jgi:hypothetical protein
MPRSKIETGTLEHESLEADDASGGFVEYLLDPMSAFSRKALLEQAPYLII